MILYCCDNCEQTVTSVISSGASPTPKGVYVSWRVEDGKHLCLTCLTVWFFAQGRGA